MSETFVPPEIKGKPLRFKKESKRDRLETLLGDKLLGIEHGGGETRITLRDGVELEPSDIDKVRKIIEEKEE